MDLATVPAAPPTRKNQRTTSWPAPISAIVPYQRGSRLMRSAFWCVSDCCAMSSVMTLQTPSDAGKRWDCTNFPRPAASREQPDLNVHQMPGHDAGPCPGVALQVTALES